MKTSRSSRANEHSEIESPLGPLNNTQGSILIALLPCLANETIDLLAFSVHDWNQIPEKKGSLDILCSTYNTGRNVYNEWKFAVYTHAYGVWDVAEQMPLIVYRPLLLDMYLKVKYGTQPHAFVSVEGCYLPLPSLLMLLTSLTPFFW
jgi:hypothetical protein